MAIVGRRIRAVVGYLLGATNLARRGTLKAIVVSRISTEHHNLFQLQSDGPREGPMSFA